ADRRARARGDAVSERAANASDKFVVVGVRADPEPNDLAAVRHDSQGAIVQAYSYGMDRFGRRDRLEVQAGMSGVLLKALERVSGQLFDRIRQRPQGDPKLRCGAGFQSFSGS